MANLGIGLGLIKFSDQIREAVRNPLPYDIVVHGAQLVADSGLNFGVEAALPARSRVFTGLRLYILHDLFHASPRVKSLEFRVNSLISKPFAGSVSGINSKCAGKFRNRGTFIELGRSQAGTGGHPRQAASSRILLAQDIIWSGDVPITARC